VTDDFGGWQIFASQAAKLSEQPGEA